MVYYIFVNLPRVFAIRIHFIERIRILRNKTDQSGSGCTKRESAADCTALPLAAVISTLAACSCTFLGKFWKFKNHLYLEITKRENKLFIINYMVKKNHNILITLINEFMNNQKTYSSGQHKAWKKFDIEQTWQNV